MKRTGTRLPVVFATVSEPVAIGLVESLPRPGRNFTGFTTINRELMSKRLEILKETIPGLARLGYLANPAYEVHRPQLDEIRATAQRMRLTLHVEEVRAASQISEALARMAVAHAGAVIVQQDDLFVTNRALVIAAAAEHRLPGMYVFSLYPRSGGLMSYGANAEDLYRRAAQHMDRILRAPGLPSCPSNGPSSSISSSTSRRQKRSHCRSRRRCFSARTRSFSEGSRRPRTRGCARSGDLLRSRQGPTSEVFARC